ncbi:hypothetical protein ISCGN_004668 [Ixodes scapularis]
MRGKVRDDAAAFVVRRGSGDALFTLSEFPRKAAKFACFRRERFPPDSTRYFWWDPDPVTGTRPGECDHVGCHRLGRRRCVEQATCFRGRDTHLSL